MALYIDNAYLPDIIEVARTVPLAGVTMNPTILLAAYERGQHIPPLQLLKELLRELDGIIFMQPGETAEENMYQQALTYIEADPGRAIPKIPMTHVGMRVVRKLKQHNHRFAFTAVNTAAQAYVAGVMGAEFIIPYYNRMERASENAGQRIAEMAKVVRDHQFKTRILAASIKTPQEAANALLAGAHDITAPPEVLLALIRDAQTENAVERFARDWQKMNGLS